MIRFFKKRSSLKQCAEIWFSKAENASNVVVKDLISLIKNCCNNKPKDIDKQKHYCEINTLMICHAERGETTSRKFFFLKGDLNDYKWWKKYVSEHNHSLYLFCCNGYYALYWNVINFTSPSILSYNRLLGFTLDYPELEQTIKKYFCSVRSNLIKVDRSDEIKSIIILEKENMIDDLKEELQKAYSQKNKYKALTLKFQLVCGFQNRANNLVWTKKV